MNSRRLAGFVQCTAFVATFVLSSRTSPGQVVQSPSARFVEAASRISESVDETRLTVLKGNTIPLANARNDRGAASKDMQLHRMLMLLRRSPEQETSLNTLLESQQEPDSPQFHHWLTPTEFGEGFGPAKEDLAIISNWLAAHGFTDISVSKGGTVIEFGGTASQVYGAFHTEIHSYSANGAVHLANRKVLLDH
jgi:trimeric autotransporter adhesin